MNSDDSHEQLRYPRPMGRPRAKWSDKDQHPFEDNPFIEDLIDWMGSSEGQDSIEVADVDARRRKIVWPDGKRPSIEQSAAGDIRMLLMEEFDQLMKPWLEDYEHKRSAGGK